MFTSSGCGSCHELAATESFGTAGPSLDGRSLSAAGIEKVVREGGTGMPAYDKQLSEAELAALVRFVARASR